MQTLGSYKPALLQENLQENLKANHASAILLSQGHEPPVLYPLFRWLSSELSKFASLLSSFPLSPSFPPFFCLYFLATVIFSSHVYS